ncbi:YheC/YheD family protein [Bacillus sp. Bos-x628]|uniref:YheC/YheD family protein n=1 Tax=Bacillus maqinnsis TaxID=3229854 RepID=UPI00338E72FE
MMSTLGVVTLSTQHEETFTLQLAKAASPFGLEIVRFTPLDLKPTSNLIQGQKFKVGQGFVSEEFPIPDFIYDRCLYQHDSRSKKAKPIMNWLKKYPKTTFLNTGFPNQMILFEQLQHHPSLNPYLPVCSLLKEPSDLIEMVKENGYCKMHPLSQQHSAPAYLIYMNDQSTLTVQLNQKHFITFSSQSDAERWCQKYLGRYLLQYFNTPFQNDFLLTEIRIFLMKDAQHQWHCMGNYIKSATKNSFLRNTQNSNHMLVFDHYLNTLQPHIRQLLLDDMSTIHSSLPAYLETRFSPFIEFAVDLLHTSEGKLFISNIMSKPGRSAFLKVFPEKENKFIRCILEHGQSMISQQKEVHHAPKTLYHRSSFNK